MLLLETENQTFAPPRKALFDADFCGDPIYGGSTISLLRWSYCLMAYLLYLEIAWKG